MTRRRPAVLSSLMLALAACTGLPLSSTPTPAASTVAPTTLAPSAIAPTSTANAPTEAPAPAVIVDERSPAQVHVLPVLNCTEFTGGDIDYGPDTGGGKPDLEAATRALRGVRWLDLIAVDGSKAAVIRDGRAIFIGSWFRSSSNGWLIYMYEACHDAGISLTPPRGLVPDAIAEIVVDGGVRVRTLPTAAGGSINEPLLVRGDEVFIIDGPVQADGSDWYLVEAVVEGSCCGPFGWVAAAGRDGEPWIEDRTNSTCPSMPNDARRLGVIVEPLLLHCFGGTGLAFELDSGLSCRPADALAIEPTWMNQACYSLSGDACGSCGLAIAIDPAHGAFPGRGQEGWNESALWAISGHFDDPAAATCVLGAPAGAADPPPELAVHRCRTTFVLTSLIRLGPSAD